MWPCSRNFSDCSEKLLLQPHVVWNVGLQSSLQCARYLNCEKIINYKPNLKKGLFFGRLYLSKVNMNICKIMSHRSTRWMTCPLSNRQIDDVNYRRQLLYSYIFRFLLYIYGISDRFYILSKIIWPWWDYLYSYSVTNLSSPVRMSPLMVVRAFTALGIIYAHKTTKLK